MPVRVVLQSRRTIPSRLRQLQMRTDLDETMLAPLPKHTTTQQRKVALHDVDPQPQTAPFPPRRPQENWLLALLHRGESEAETSLITTLRMSPELDDIGRSSEDADRETSDAQSPKPSRTEPEKKRHRDTSQESAVPTVDSASKVKTPPYVPIITDPRHSPLTGN